MKGGKGRERRQGRSKLPRKERARGRRVVRKEFKLQSSFLCSSAGGRESDDYGCSRSPPLSHTTFARIHHLGLKVKGSIAVREIGGRLTGGHVFGIRVRIHPFAVRGGRGRTGRLGA